MVDGIVAVDLATLMGPSLKFNVFDGRISVIDYPITDEYVMAFQTTANSTFSSTAFSD